MIYPTSLNLNFLIYKNGIRIALVWCEEDAEVEDVHTAPRIYWFVFPTWHVLIVRLLYAKC